MDPVGEQPPAHLVRRGHRFVSLYLFILLTALAVGLTYGWQHRKVVDLRKQVTSLKSQVSTLKLSKANLATRQAQFLIEQAIPAGWTIESNNGDNLVLTNTQTKCFVNFYKYNEPTARAADPGATTQAQTAATIKGIKDKGYSVTELPAGKLTVNTVLAGQTSLPTTELSTAGPGNLRQSYAYYVQDGYYIGIARSCNTASDLSTTDKALLAVLVF